MLTTTLRPAFSRAKRARDSRQSGRVLALIFGVAAGSILAVTSLRRAEAIAPSATGLNICNRYPGLTSGLSYAALRAAFFALKARNNTDDAKYRQLTTDNCSSRLLRSGHCRSIYLFQIVRGAALQQRFANLLGPAQSGPRQFVFRARIVEPSGLATMAVSRRLPSLTSANAPIGTWQPPPSLFSTARSQVVVARAAASSRNARCLRISTSPSRISIPSAPCPAAGHMNSSDKHFLHQFGLAEPSQPCSGQDNRIVFALLQLAHARVDVAAQRMNARSGRATFSCACRRRLLVPTRAPLGSASECCRI